MPRMLLAALFLFALLLPPADAMPGPAADIDQIALLSLCHGGGGNQAPAPAHHDCLLCPACHLSAHAAIAAPAGPILALPALLPSGRAAAWPPAIGPPARPRPVAFPTGPPPPV